MVVEARGRSVVEGGGAGTECLMRQSFSLEGETFGRWMMGRVAQQCKRNVLSATELHS